MLKRHHRSAVQILLPAIAMLAAGSAAAAEEPMICAITEVVSCQKHFDCSAGAAEAFDMPLFLRIDAAAGEIVSLRESGEQQVSVIKQTASDEAKRFVIYQGVERGGAWSTVVDSTNGSLTISVAAGESDTFSMFGTCSKALLKP